MDSPFACMTLRVAFAVASVASRRRKASCGVSPGRINEESRTGGDIGAVGRAESGTGLTLLGPTPFSSGRSPAVSPDDGAGVASAMWRCDLFRRAGFCPNSRSSQRRRVSRPISTPISRRPAVSVSTDSPACLSRSNSSRWDTSRTVAWLRGNRDCSTASAKVVGREVVSGGWMGSDMVVNGERYAWCLGSARGAPQAQSKRKRLDVGVVTCCFVLFLLDESGYFLSSLIGWFIRLVDFLDFVFGALVELVPLRFWLHRLAVHFSSRVVLGSFNPSLVAGGGGC